MPLTQNAPCEPGCSGLGAILVTLPASMVSSEPHNAEHSQHVLGTVSVATTVEGRTFIAKSSASPKVKLQGQAPRLGQLTRSLQAVRATKTSPHRNHWRR